MSTAIAIARPAGLGLGAFGALLAVYFGVLTLVSGWSFTANQFTDFWFYIVLERDEGARPLRRLRARA